MKYRTSRYFLLFIILNLTYGIKLFSQPLPDSLTNKIDSLFRKWDNEKSPGCIIGIVRNDSLIYTKGYGMANLEYSIPITSETVFHMASVSKQFTAYSIILLAKQGRLHMDDDIHKYLVDFPDLKEKITVRNLLNHTSGIRDQWQLLSIAGIRPDDVITQALLLRILNKQQALNFKPGKDFSYSNSNYTLLAEIVRIVSGQSLRKFTDSAIFKPLGMNRTHFRDDLTELEINRSASYYRVGESHFANSIFSNSAVGATNLYTTVPDMSKWVSNFFNPKVGSEKDIALLTHKTKLSNGSLQDYAFGIISDTYKGWRQYSHAGGDAGYRSYLSVFPDLKMGFMVFSNIGDVGGYLKAHQLADFFINDTTITVSSPLKIDSSKTILTDTIKIKHFLGDYIEEGGQRMNFSVNEGKVFLISSYFGGTFLLSPVNDTVFSFLNGTDIKFLFSRKHKKEVLYIVYPENERFLFTKYNSNEVYSEEKLKAYTGAYYCPELECKYEILLKGHQLFIKNLKYDMVPITLSGGPNHLFTGFPWMNHLMVIRDKKKKITGFEINSGRVKYLRFNKID